MADISWTSTERNKVRLLSGIDSEEMDNSNLDILMNMSVDWFQQQTNLTYTLGEFASYDSAVVYYSCFLVLVAQTGVGVQRIRLADVEVQYDNDQFQYFVDLALEMINLKRGVSIKRSTYNADPWLGEVNWLKNIDGVDSTKNIRPRPKGMQYDN
ncbi:MAG: hypothetical protein QF704_17260 [Anaerolineales bacterium]|jgi:hypothetical protein|nr:hypothetical protein [Anaerolineales bacterium]|tara:strand:+ start:40 stop:504 length:465 start_codon:yes stop_codon:yes gene_type:complete